MPRQILDALPDGVVIADSEGIVTVVSDVAGTMLDVPLESAVGRPLDEVLQLRNRHGQAWVACNTPYQGLPSRTGIPEQSWLLPDGTEVLVAARISRWSRGGPVSRVAVAMRSGRGRARVDRERSDLVATVAHELRSPLTGVKGFVQVMLNRWDQLSDDQKKLMLTTVSADSDRLSRLIAELLDVARIDTGRLQLSPRPTDAQTLVRRVVDSVVAGTARRIELDAPEQLPPVAADPDKFTQVVTNLVENAVRHGDGTVRVRLEPLDGDADWPGVALLVDDEGDGIPEAIRAQAFVKFWQSGGAGGSGLGLYLVHGLVRAHGGTVTIADAPGGGARVVVHWPAHQA